MRRFNYDDNDDYKEDVDSFFKDDNQDISEEYAAIAAAEEREIQEIQFKFVTRDLNHRMMRTAIRTCEKSFWWQFYFQDTKLRLIDKTYKKLKKLLEDE